jgi:hypothetical protein
MMAAANNLLEQLHGDTGVHMQQKHCCNRRIGNAAQGEENWGRQYHMHTEKQRWIIA